MKKWWKHEEEIKVKQNDKYHDYLTKRKLQLMQVVNMTDGVCVDVSGKQYKIVKCMFTIPNGVNDEEELNNREKIKNVLNELGQSKKYVFLKERENNLDDNIRYYEFLLKNETRKVYAESIEKKIVIMNYYNKFKNISFYIFLENENFGGAISKLKQVYDPFVLSEKEIVQLLKKLNNGME